MLTIICILLLHNAGQARERLLCMGYRLCHVLAVLPLVLAALLLRL
jgi:hypothetical protein